MEELFSRPTASQLHLDSAAQVERKLGYKSYWDNIFAGSKNPDAEKANLAKPEFLAAYASAASDDYKLLGLDFGEIPPASSDEGYSLLEVKNYMVSIDTRNEYDPTISKLEAEWNEASRLQ